MIWDETFGTIAALAGGINLWQWVEGRLFPLHRRARRRNALPPISVLKPLKGIHDGLKECLESWMVQNYQGAFEILFILTDRNDPAYQLVCELSAKHSLVPARILFCNERPGTNEKVCKLICALREAQHELIVISDADVQAPPDLLTNLAIGLEASNAGLVCCFYRTTGARTLVDHIEAVAINSDFWTGVLQARRLFGLQFGLGAVMATRKSTLHKIGGLERLANHLADDYWLGRLIAEHGEPVILCPVVVNLTHGRQTWKHLWHRHVRWARTIRVSEPVGYFFSILSNVTLWTVLWMLTSSLKADLPIGASLLLLRLVLAAEQQHRMTQGWRHLRWVWVPWLKDLLGAIWWLSGWIGNRIYWAGRWYRLRFDGTISPLVADDASPVTHYTPKRGESGK